MQDHMTAGGHHQRSECRATPAAAVVTPDLASTRPSLMAHAAQYVVRLALVMSSLVPLTSQAQSVHHPAGAFVTISGKRIWYESEGAGDPLILLPGGPGGSHDYFHPFFSRLRGAFRVIYFDPFGTGRSGRSTNIKDYSLAGEIEEIEGLRNALALGRINLLGHSYGGVLAQAYVERYPGSVKRLILSNALVTAAAWNETNAHANAETKEFFPENTDRMAELQAQGAGSMSPEMAKASPDPAKVTAHFFFYDRSNAHYIVFNDTTFNPEVSSAIGGDNMDVTVGGDLAHFDFRNTLRSLRVPILIMAGREDGVVLPRLAQELRRAAPQAEFVMFERSGHYPFIEETDKAMRVITTFLRGPG
jgi:proline iminopeptidase